MSNKYKAVRIKEDVYKKLKVEAVEQECSMLKLIEKLLLEHLENKKTHKLFTVSGPKTKPKQD